jgi:hypothetical protein
MMRARSRAYGFTEVRLLNGIDAAERAGHTLGEIAQALAVDPDRASLCLCHLGSGGDLGERSAIGLDRLIIGGECRR